MGILSMTKMVFTPTPRWIKGVLKNGSTGTAVVLSDPQDVMKGVAGYRGKDGFLDFDGDVLTDVGEQYQAKVKARLSQILGGMLERGMKVNVRYDPRDKTHVVLADDVTTLLGYRVKT